MNSSQNAQRRNRAFFTGSVVASIVLLGLSAAAILSLSQSTSSKNLELANKACLAAMRDTEFKPDTSTKGQISINRARSNQVEETVYQAGVIVASCPGYTLTEFCAGEGCPTPGVSFTLKQK